MCFRWLAISLFLSTAPAPAAARPLTWWIANPLTKVRPQDPPPDSPRTSVDLHAGRNEFEPFQLVLRGGEKDLTGLDIEFSDFHAADGADISKENITVYFEQCVDVAKSSSSNGAAGRWPDPLIPRVDRYAHEKRNAFPFDLAPGHNQALWIEIYVPPSARRGRYEGTARVLSKGAARFSVPVTLTVWGFKLPSTSTLRTSFGFNGTTALKQHRGRYTTDDDLYALTRLYTKAALLHRISIHGGSEVPPKYRYSNGHMQIDWAPYDAEVGPFLDGTAIPAGEPLYGAQTTSVELRTPPSLDTEDQQTAWWKAWAGHFRKAGWSDRLFLYLWDEPRAADLPKVLARGRLAAAADPSIPTLVTLPFSSQLADVVRIWVPLVNCLEPKPGYDDFCEQAPGLDAYRGRDLWFYQSCASHGCNIAGGAYFAGWPSYMIDVPAPANRVMQWVAWKYRVRGELYYSMDEAYSAAGDPWTNFRLFGGNGDGTLFYPGRPAQIGGTTDIPIESIRLKLIREGMEDYEYLVLLDRLAGRQTADRFGDRIVQKPFLWENNPEAFLNTRLDMGETLDRLASGVTGKLNGQ
ncbi:MAG TPA: glycoside hydrolase domain-containing protein [Bryobacteraceae bacterium]|nr:glycoside hydrolase domain-containing protein [Bryobacteraceae bacterium]